MAVFGPIYRDHGISLSRLEIHHTHLVSHTHTVAVCGVPLLLLYRGRLATMVSH